MDPARSLVLAQPSAEPAYRAAPHNTEAEQALLGAILVNNATYHRVSEFLLPDHFYNPAHQRIYAAAVKLIERGQIADPATLKGYFEQDEALTDIGGAQYLGRLAASVVTIINAGDYGRTIYDCYLRRQLIEIGTETVNDAYEHDIDLEARQLMEVAEKKLFDLATRGNADGGFQPFVQALRNAALQAEQAYKRSGKTSGVSTGFTDVDSLLGGLHPSDLVIIAGRPSMGKTALATNIAFNAAKAYRTGRGPTGEVIAEDGAVVGFYSLEMSAEQLATRVLAEESGVSGDKIRRGEVAREEFDAFIQASMKLESVPLYIDDTPALTISAVRTRARRLKRQHGLHLIIVDYLQLLQGTPKPGGEQNRVQEISEITRGLKALAKELDVPVIALSQLSRAVEQREDKRPMLSDLRESGSIEQDADVVMFVFREEYYLGRAEPGRRPEESEDKFNQRHAEWWERLQQVSGTGEVIIAKQRHGPIGKVTLKFDGATTRFSDYVGRDHLPDADY
ncbi:MAG: replicative helicase [Aliidongia sp.]|jgi:replicative DNA helicase|nr:replicative helicase [Aliidongia sp.]